MFDRFEPCITVFLLNEADYRCSYCNSRLEGIKAHYLIIKDNHFNWHRVCFPCSIGAMELLKKRIEKVSDVCKSCEGYGSFCVDNMYEVDPASDKPEMRQCSACEGIGRILK